MYIIQAKEALEIVSDIFIRLKWKVHNKYETKSEYFIEFYKGCVAVQISGTKSSSWFEEMLTVQLIAPISLRFRGLLDTKENWRALQEVPVEIDKIVKSKTSIMDQREMLKVLYEDFYS